MLEYFNEENRVARKARREQKRKEKRDAEIALYRKVIEESHQITTKSELGDVYYNHPKGTICYLDDKNIFVKECDDYPTWRRKQIIHKLQIVYDNPWGCDGDFDYTRDFYPNSKIRKELKRERDEEGKELTKAEQNVVKHSSLKSLLFALIWIGIGILYEVYFK